MTNLAYLTEQEFYRTVVALLDSANATISKRLARLQESQVVANDMEWADDLYEAAAVQKLMLATKRYIDNGHMADGAAVYEYLTEIALNDERPFSSTSQSSNMMGTQLHFQAIRLARKFAKYANK